MQDYMSDKKLSKRVMSYQFKENDAKRYLVQVSDTTMML